jgi:uncharacterized protein YbbC (DUF1343 family)
MMRMFKHIVLFILLILNACASKTQSQDIQHISNPIKRSIETGASQFDRYAPLLKDKRVGIVTNQTGIIQKSYQMKDHESISIVDFLLSEKVNLQKIYAPEHGFRGTADAGELIKDGKDAQTGLPIISLYGNNKKPKPEDLVGIDVMIFDLQDVGARFYTYISSLHYVMEACAEQNIPLIVLDRPNPNGGIIDGPLLEKEHTSFVGMHPIPVLHGMTIGEYAQMINGEKWLKNGIQCNLSVISCLNYAHDMHYSLPVKPSPNLPNDTSINLYASLCFFEGTNVSVGRGTDKQFQIFGSPFLPQSMSFKNHKGGDIIKENYTFTPQPNEGAKDPLYNQITCYGVDLSQHKKINQLNLSWLIWAYRETKEPTKFFNDFFTKLAGTQKLREQIQSGMTEDEIRLTWQKDLSSFQKTRKLYLLYP